MRPQVVGLLRRSIAARVTARRGEAVIIDVRKGLEGDTMVDFFIKFDGIKGESADAKHKDEIDVESWSWGETHTVPPRCGWRRGRGQGLDAGLPFRDEAEQGQPALMRACATGQHIKMATLSARKAGKGQQEYLTFKFHDVLVSSFQTGGSEAAALS